MFKNFINLTIILLTFLYTGLNANAADWRAVNNNVGNLIYVDTASIQKKDNKIFYYVKYYEDQINNNSKVLIISEGNHPFVVGDPVAYKNNYFMSNMTEVNTKVMNYIKDKDIPEISPDNDLNYLITNLEPYAESVITKIKSNLKYKFGYRNSSASVMVKINKNGELKKIYIQKSSGNQKLNKALIKAVEVSAPFDPLPEDYDKTFAILWIDVSFDKDKSVILMNSVVSLAKMLLR